MEISNNCHLFCSEMCKVGSSGRRGKLGHLFCSGRLHVLSMSDMDLRRTDRYLLLLEGRCKTLYCRIAQPDSVFLMLFFYVVDSAAGAASAFSGHKHVVLL
jgi:hypothetical protein